jgi:hypothetical protein
MLLFGCSSSCSRRYGDKENKFFCRTNLFLYSRSTQPSRRLHVLSQLKSLSSASTTLLPINLIPSFSTLHMCSKNWSWSQSQLSAFSTPKRRRRPRPKVILRECLQCTDQSWPLSFWLLKRLLICFKMQRRYI